MSFKIMKCLGWRRYTLHLVAKALHLHAKIENGQPVGIDTLAVQQWKDTVIKQHVPISPMI